MPCGLDISNAPARVVTGDLPSSMFQPLINTPGVYSHCIFSVLLTSSSILFFEV
jgi:hypothetical protein